MSWVMPLTTLLFFPTPLHLCDPEMGFFWWFFLMYWWFLHLITYWESTAMNLLTMSVEKSETHGIWAPWWCSLPIESINWKMSGFGNWLDDLYKIKVKSVVLCIYLYVSVYIYICCDLVNRSHQWSVVFIQQRNYIYNYKYIYM